MRQIKINYPRKIEQRQLGDKLYVMEAIRDLDEAIDLICQALPEGDHGDPFAEDLCPYFGILWPAAEALASFIQDHAFLIKAKSVLELGSGLGFPSLVASHLGAQVLASDFHPDVEEYFLRNCRHCSLTGNYQRLNWREEAQYVGTFDVVMGSDVLYESKHPRDLSRGLLRYLKPGGKILLSDPGRSYLRPFVATMRAEGFSVQQTEVFINSQSISVLLFERD
jgi:predicted nicotinamide N-methyase